MPILSNIKPFFNEDNNTFIYGDISIDSNNHISFTLKSKETGGNTDENIIFSDSLSAFGLHDNLFLDPNQAITGSILPILSGTDTHDYFTSNSLTYNPEINEYSLTFLQNYMYTTTAEHPFPVIYYFTFKYIDGSILWQNTSYHLPEYILTTSLPAVVEIDIKATDLVNNAHTYTENIPTYGKVIFNCLSAAPSTDFIRSIEYHYGDGSAFSETADHIESRLPLNRLIQSSSDHVERVEIEDFADMVDPKNRIIKHTYSVSPNTGNGQDFSNTINAWVKVYTFDDISNPYIYTVNLEAKAQSVFDTFKGINIIDTNFLYDSDTSSKSINISLETSEPRYATIMTMDDINGSFADVDRGLNTMYDTWLSNIVT
jgi:hypothetical protein